MDHQRLSGPFANKVSLDLISAVIVSVAAVTVGVWLMTICATKKKTPSPAEKDKKTATPASGPAPAVDSKNMASTKPDGPPAAESKETQSPLRDGRDRREKKSAQKGNIKQDKAKHERGKSKKRKPKEEHMSDKKTKGETMKTGDEASQKKIVSNPIVTPVSDEYPTERALADKQAAAAAEVAKAKANGKDAEKNGATYPTQEQKTQDEATPPSKSQKTQSDNGGGSQP